MANGGNGAVAVVVCDSEEDAEDANDEAGEVKEPQATHE